MGTSPFLTEATMEQTSGLPVLTQAPMPTHVERLHQYFEQSCDRRPDGIAVVCGSSALTYEQLDRRANRLAHLLLARGVEEGTPVGILLERSFDMYVALLGVLRPVLATSHSIHRFQLIGWLSSHRTQDCAT